MCSGGQEENKEVPARLGLKNQDRRKGLILSKGRICKGCGISYTKNKGKGRYCSSECFVKNPRAKKQCKPICSTESLRTRTVVFINGSKHTQQFCLECRFTQYLDFGSIVDRDATFKERAETLRKTYGDSFYSSKEWLSLRYKAFILHGQRCLCCFAVGKPLHIDHIKPRSLYPELGLSIENLQVLCADCNIGKSNLDETDFRIARFVDTVGVKLDN